MITISLCMIVKNEEAVLRRCLDSVKDIADEIVIVDTGSSDRTVDIAGDYTDRVYRFAWVDDFAAARNESFSKATMDYILWLDADDYIDEQNRQKLLALKASFPDEVDVAMFRYNVGFDDQGVCTFHYYRERLLRRAGGYRWHEPVHEYIQMHGVTREFDIAVIHGHKVRAVGAGARNLEIYRKIEEEQGELSTRGLYYFARELRTHGLYVEAAERYRRFFDRGDGWVEDKITACGGLSDCLRALGRKEEAVEALVRSFAFALPRAEICCQLGRINLRDGQLDKGIFWYELALSVPRPDTWGFQEEDAWGYIPHIQLCVLYDRKGDREKAISHHEAAKAIKPQDPAVLHNEAYFASKA